MIETIRTYVGGILFLALIVGGISLLWMLFRYSFVSSKIKANAREVLRSPSTSDIEESIGFETPHGLVEFYQAVPFLEEKEFYLSNVCGDSEQLLDIGGFEPLIKPHIGENQKITGQKRLIIAFDMDKGFYFVAQDGSVNHWSPETGPEGHQVAPSIEIFSNFEVVDEPFDE